MHRWRKPLRRHQDFRAVNRRRQLKRPLSKWQNELPVRGAVNRRTGSPSSNRRTKRNPRNFLRGPDLQPAVIVPF